MTHSPTSTASLRQAVFAPAPAQQRSRSPAITIGLLVMPLAIAVALFADRNGESSDLVLRPSFADADHVGDSQRFTGRLAGLVP